MSISRPRASQAFAALVAAACLTLPLSMFAPRATAQAAPAALTVTVTDIKKSQGKMMIALFDQAGYEKDGEPVAAVAADVSGATVSVQLEAPPGRYGIKMFHDVNGDGKMNTNPFGIPNEPYAFSNNAKGSMGPAKWDVAAFDLPAAGGQQSIKLN